jgi:2-polyprenyl-6-methoxyphenol hydroxylase-like FAD-dependent oxidoreductase
MLSTTHSNVDVLIIGAGPSGLMAGLILTTMNLKVKIIDRRYAAFKYYLCRCG